MARLTIAFLLAIFNSERGVWGQQNTPQLEKNSQAKASTTQATQPQVISPSLSVIPLTIEPSGNSAGERVDEFAGRKEVLKSVVSAASTGPLTARVEVKLPDGILDQRPANKLYLCLSVFPPSKGTANLAVRNQQSTDLLLFRHDINQTDAPHSAILHRGNGWVDMRFSLEALERDAKTIVLELSGDPSSSEEMTVGWAICSLHLVSQVTYEELDPTKQTLFRRYSERGYGQLVDVATGKVLKTGIGIGWHGTNTTCLYSQDGSHVAIISKIHDHPRSGSTDFEQLWVYSLRPFEQTQEAKSRRFHSMQFDQDNKTLLFESSGRPEISGK